MSTPQRLPIVNSDDGTWGDIIRQYLKKEHYDDGTDNAVNGGHQNITVRPGTAAAGTAPIKLSSGTLLATKEAGAIEFNTDTLYFTVTTSTVRKTVAIYDDSTGAAGDIYYRSSSGTLINLAAGNKRQVLGITAGASAVPTWRNFNFFAINFASTSYTVTADDLVVLADASSSSITVTLPNASTVSNCRFYIKRIDNNYANTVTVAPTGIQTIDGGGSITLDLQYTSFCLYAGGASSWYIL